MSWDDLYVDPFWMEWSRRPPLTVTLDWFDALARNGARSVYDLGCGLGRHTVRLARAGFSVAASDISPRAVAATRSALGAVGLPARVFQAGMTAVPLPDASFDAVLAFGVLEHATRARVEKSVDEITRVLRPGGRLLASFVPRDRWMSGDEPGMAEDNTRLSYGPEQDLHHFVDEGEIRELLAAFTVHAITREEERGQGWVSAEFVVSAARTG